jgi:hypothetical protein
MDIGASQLSPSWGDEVIKASAKAGNYVGDWGSVWQVGEAVIIGEVKKPVLANWSKLDDFKLPWDLIRNRMFNTIFAKSFFQKWIFQQKTDVYFGLFKKKQHMWCQNGDRNLSKNNDILPLLHGRIL